MNRNSHLVIDRHLDEAEWREARNAEALEGLTAENKQISPIWFYDERGSRLFDAITDLPEYYLTGAERSLLVRHAAEIAERSRATTLVELGAGTAEKTELLIDALRRGNDVVRYLPFDVSAEVLVDAARRLGNRFDDVEIQAIVGDFHHHLSLIPGGDRRLFAFIGSTIGNLRPAERRRFLFDLDCALETDDRLLLGIDLVKDVDRLLAAYDDPSGLTAEFNKNALRVLNTELGCDFDPALFDHVVVWNEDERWIEMRLRATRPHKVHVPGLGRVIEFQEGEELLTEISAKFTVESMSEELAECGFVVEHTWTAPAGFSLLLARPYC